MGVWTQNRRFTCSVVLGTRGTHEEVAQSSLVWNLTKHTFGGVRCLAKYQRDSKGLAVRLNEAHLLQLLHNVRERLCGSFFIGYHNYFRVKGSLIGVINTGKVLYLTG